MKTPERQIVRAVAQAAAALRISIWRNNTGKLLDRRGIPVKFGFEGSGDFIGLLPDGRFLAVEVKTATGKIRESQEAFRDMVQANGGEYWLVRSVDEFFEAARKYRRREGKNVS